MYVYYFEVIDRVCCFREIDLLKEENSQLLKTIDERSVKVEALEEELKKSRNSKVDSQVPISFVW